MANGDITYLKELGRFTIPGGGGTNTGIAKNNKIVAWGEISGIWEDTNGLKLSVLGGVPALGVSKQDFIGFSVITSGGTASTHEAVFTAALNTTTSNIMVVLDGLTAPAEADVVVLNYLVVGDSNAAPDLT